MQFDLNAKLKALLWDVPEKQRTEMVNRILEDPAAALRNEQLFLRVLNSLRWYDLIRLLDIPTLVSLLSDRTISKVYPAQRRIYYTNAIRLLSKYSVSSSGQGA